MDHQDEDCGYDGGESERQDFEVSSLYERRTSLPTAIHIDFSKATINTSHYSSNYELDDEVFIEFEEWQTTRSLTQSEIMTQVRDAGRRRRTSDVIDSLGIDQGLETEVEPRSRRATSPDISDTLPHFESHSPLTPRSDGYWSGSVTSVSSPLEPKWFRFSQSGESHVSISRQSSVRSETRPSLTINCDSFEVRSSRLRRSTVGDGEMSSSSVHLPDTVDSKPSENSFQAPTTPIRRDFEVKETLAPVGKDCDVYNMSHARRGLAIIFNHETFRSTLPERKGSAKDVESLVGLYRILGFDVQVHNDFTSKEIYDTLAKVSQDDHKDSDCICINVLTHGLDGEYLYAYDTPYACSDLYNLFSASSCLSLAGKPKIFIIQACRGKSLDVGVRLVSRTTTDSSPSTSYTIPAMADFLIANSTFGGFYSWRNPEDGTWYIQSLVNILLDQHPHVDLLTMMTRVACNVATSFESYNDVRPDLSGMKQAPSLVSTLIRQIYFKPKA